MGTPAEVVHARDEARLLALSDPQIEIVGPRGSVRGHDPGTGEVVGEAPIASHYRGNVGQVVDVARHDRLETAPGRAGLDETDWLG